MVSTLLSFILVLGYGQVEGPSSVQIEASLGQMSRIRSEWTKLLPAEDISKIDARQRLRVGKDLYFISTGFDQAAFWKSTGHLMQYRVSETGRRLLDKLPRIDISRSGSEAHRYADAVVQPHSCQFAGVLGGAHKFATSWNGIPFSDQVVQVRLHPSGGLLEIWSPMDRFPENPSEWRKESDIGEDVALGQAAGALADHVTFSELSLVGSRLVYFYRDPERVSRLPRSVGIITRQDGLQAFNFGLVPGKEYSPATAVCYQVVFRIMLDNEVGGSSYVDWSVYIDALTGQPINAEMCPGLLAMNTQGQKSNDTNNGIARPEVYLKRKWRRAKLENTSKKLTPAMRSLAIVRIGNSVLPGKLLNSDHVLVTHQGRPSLLKLD